MPEAFLLRRASTSPPLRQMALMMLARCPALLPRGPMRPMPMTRPLKHFSRRLAAEAARDAMVAYRLTPRLQRLHHAMLGDISFSHAERHSAMDLLALRVSLRLLPIALALPFTYRLRRVYFDRCRFAGTRGDGDTADAFVYHSACFR